MTLTTSVDLVSNNTQASEKTYEVKTEIINVEGFFQNPYTEDDNGIKTRSTVINFIYDIKGYRYHLEVMNPVELLDSNGHSIKLNKYYRVKGYCVEPKIGSRYLYFLNVCDN